MSLFDSLTARGATPMLERFTAFTEARHRMLTENIANVDTPGYRTQQLDVRAFQAELRRASGARERPTESLKLRRRREFSVGDSGSLDVRPTLEPAENLMFHDGTNGRIERQMSMLAENGMAHQLAVELLKGKYGGMLTAIRGRVQ